MVPNVLCFSEAIAGQNGPVITAAVPVTEYHLYRLTCAGSDDDLPEMAERLANIFILFISEICRERIVADSLRQDI